MDNPHGLTVELRPSIGKYDSPIGQGEQVHAQWEVWAGNKQTVKTYGHALVRVGMCSLDGKHINWESHAAKWPRDGIAYVAAEVKRLTKCEEEPSVSIPSNPAPPHVEDLDDEIDVTDLDELEE